jgi:hypothetical protein
MERGLFIDGYSCSVNGYWKSAENSSWIIGRMFVAVIDVSLGVRWLGEGDIASKHLVDQQQSNHVTGACICLKTSTEHFVISYNPGLVGKGCCKLQLHLFLSIPTSAFPWSRNIKSMFLKTSAYRAFLWPSCWNLELCGALITFTFIHTFPPSNVTQDNQFFLLKYH